MIPLQGEATRELLLMHLVHLIEAGNHECLIEAGLDPKLLHRLRNLPNRDTKRLASMKVPMQMSIDGDALNQALNAISSVNAQQEMFEAFIKRGASIPMLRQLFRVDNSLIAFTRQALNAPVSRGRPTLPDPETREAILQAWQSSTSAGTPKERYWLMSQKFPDLRLDTLWTAITSLDANEAGHLEAV